MKKKMKYLSILVSIAMLFGSFAILPMQGKLVSAVSIDDYLTVVQDFSNAAIGTFTGETIWDNPVVVGGNLYANTTIDNGDGTKSVSLDLPGGTWVASPAAGIFRFKDRAPTGSEAVVVRMTNPAASPDAGYRLTDTSTIYPMTFFRKIVNEDGSGNPDWTNTHSWKYDFSANPVTCYMITTEGTVTEHTLSGSSPAENMFVPFDFDGWVVLPLGYFDAQSSTSVPMDPTKLAALEVSYGDCEPNYAPVFHEIAFTTSVTDLIGFFSEPAEPTVYDYLSVVQDFSDAAIGTFTEATIWDNPVVVGGNMFANTTIDNGDGTKSVSLDLPGGTWVASPAAGIFRFKDRAPTGSEAVVVRMTNPAASPDAGYRLTDTSTIYPMTFFRQIVNEDATGYPDWTNNHTWQYDFSANPVTCYMITTEGTVTEHTLSGSSPAENMFVPFDFDGLVVLPLGYFTAQSSTSAAMDPTKLAALEVSYGDCEPNYAPVFHEIAFTTSVTDLIGFFSEPAEPTATPTAEPTAAPTVEPTAEPTAVPTAEPTAVPTYPPSSNEHLTVVQNFSSAVPGTYSGETIWDNPVVIGGRMNSNTTVENGDGSKSVKLNLIGSTWIDNPTAAVFKFDYRALPGSDAVVIRMTNPAASPDAGYRLTDTGSVYPMVFFRKVVNENTSGDPDWTNTHTWRRVFSSVPLTVYTIDAETETVSEHVLSSQHPQENMFVPFDFDGWVVIPLKYFMTQSSGGTAMDPTKLVALEVGYGDCEEGYEPIFHEIAFASSMADYLGTYGFDVPEPTLTPTPSGEPTPIPTPVIMFDAAQHDYYTVVQDFDDAVEGVTFTDEDKWSNQFVINGGANFVGTTTIVRTDGSKSVELTMNGSMGMQNPAHVLIKFKERGAANSEAIVIRLSNPSSSDPENDYRVTATDSVYPQVFFRQLVHEDVNGNPDWANFHYWKANYSDDPITCYLVDAQSGAATSHVLNGAMNFENVFTPLDFDGWIVIPLTYFNPVNYAETETTIQPDKIMNIELSYGDCESAYKPVLHEVAMITSISDFIGYFASPDQITLTEQPEDAIISSGETGVFNVAATTSEGTLSYQWQKSTDGETWEDITGATETTYTTPESTALDSGTKYRCVITVTKGLYSASLNSGTATLFVDQYPDIVIDQEKGFTEIIPASLFADNKGKNVKIIINVYEYDQIAYSWTFDGLEIEEAMDFDPAIELLDVADIGLGDTAPDAVYFRTLQIGGFPGPATFTVDTSFNFFENEDMYLYSYTADGPVFELLVDGFLSGAIHTSFTISTVGTYLLSNVDLDDSEDPGTSDPDTNPQTSEGGIFQYLMLLAVAMLALAVYPKFKKIHNHSN